MPQQPKQLEHAGGPWLSSPERLLWPEMYGRSKRQSPKKWTRVTCLCDRHARCLGGRWGSLGAIRGCEKHALMSYSNMGKVRRETHRSGWSWQMALEQSRGGVDVRLGEE